jgi:cytoskeletal protein CcmA (bactofilin family)
MVIALVSPLIGPAAAQDEHPEEAGRQKVVSLPAGAVINKDYFAYGERVEISGTVNGDVYVAAGEVLVDGRINGDLLAAGGTITISGSVSQNVRVAGGEITLSGKIGRNLTVAGGNVGLNESAAVAGGLVAAGGRVRLAAPVGKDAKIAAGSVLVSGPINGNLEAVTGDVRLTSKAAVSGDLIYWSQRRASITQGAKVGGVVTRKTMPEFSRPRVGTLLGALAGVVLLAKLVSVVSTLILGLLLVYVFPRYTQSTVSTLRQRPWASLGVGVVALVATPVAAGMLLITVLGVPLALMVTALYLMALYLARVFVIVWIGTALVAWRGREVRPVLGLMIGLFVYSLLTLIPFIGGVVTLLVILFGLGASLQADRSVFLAAREKGTV